MADITKSNRPVAHLRFFLVGDFQVQIFQWCSRGCITISIHLFKSGSVDGVWDLPSMQVSQNFTVLPKPFVYFSGFTKSITIRTLANKKALGRRWLITSEVMRFQVAWFQVTRFQGLSRRHHKFARKCFHIAVSPPSHEVTEWCPNTCSSIGDSCNTIGAFSERSHFTPSFVATFGIFFCLANERRWAVTSTES